MGTGRTAGGMQESRCGLGGRRNGIGAGGNHSLSRGRGQADLVCRGGARRGKLNFLGQPGRRMRMGILGSRSEREFRPGSRSLGHKKDKTEIAVAGGSSLPLPFETVSSTLGTTALQQTSSAHTQSFWKETPKGQGLQRPRFNNLRTRLNWQP